MKLALALSAVSLCLLLAAGAARADVAPPNSTECNTLSAGAACVDDNSKAGVCTASMCSELDYSHGTPPTSKEVPCLLCVAGTGGTSAGGSAGGGCAVAPATGGEGFWLVAAALALPLLRRRRSR